MTLTTLGKSLLPLAAFSLLGAPVIAQTGPAAPALVARDQVMTLSLGHGLNQRILYNSPPHPRATLVMLPGGSGDIAVQLDGDLRHDDNFVVRTRADWVAKGYAVLIPDTIDHASLRGVRSSPEYGRLVESLAAYARAHAPAPVFLVGTSQGTIAAMNGAAHARLGLVAGLILTESVSVPGRLSTETVFDADPSGVRIPVLVVANHDDSCNVAPPEMAPRIAAAMTHSPSVLVLSVSGGIQRSARACGSLSPHGYYGIEQKVVGEIAGWLQTHGG